MGLTNTQYDQLMRNYSRDRAAQLRALEARRARIYGEIPALTGLDEQISSGAAESAILRLDGRRDEAEALREKTRDLMRRRRELLSRYGFAPEDLELQYICPDCKDTGYANGQKCHCFYRRAVDLFYTQSGLRTALEKENFDTFSLDVYDDREKNPATGLTPRQNMVRVEKVCRQFVDRFDTGSGHLLFYGGTGLGKTFLSNCIAKALIETAHSVIYYSAPSLFEALSAKAFGSGEHTDEQDPFTAYLTDCDLLIIDDLGTEITNAFVSSRLFYLLNKRLLLQKSIVISTNLSLSEFAGVYSERIFSRISSSFTLLGFYGDDIRIKNKVQRQRK